MRILRPEAGLDDSIVLPAFQSALFEFFSIQQDGMIVDWRLPVFKKALYVPPKAVHHVWILQQLNIFELALPVPVGPPKVPQVTVVHVSSKLCQQALQWGFPRDGRQGESDMQQLGEYERRHSGNQVVGVYHSINRRLDFIRKPIAGYSGAPKSIAGAGRVVANLVGCNHGQRASHTVAGDVQGIALFK